MDTPLVGRGYKFMKIKAIKIKKETLFKCLKIVGLLAIVAAISVGLYILLDALGLTDIALLKQWLQRVGPWAIVVYIFLRVLCTIFLSFMPATSMIFDLLSIAAFDYLHPFFIFLICLASIVITSVIMDLIGRFGGNQLVIKIIGQKDYDEASELIQQKGMVYVPFMYLLPIFPDDAICMISGATKMNFFVHLIEIVLCRGIACATIIFGVSIIPPEISSFTSTNPLDYIRVATLIGAYLFLFFHLARTIDKYLTKKLQDRKQRKLEKNLGK